MSPRRNPAVVSGRSRQTLPLLIALMALPSIMLPPGIAWGNPTGGTVTSGNASISNSPGNVTIRQSTDKAIVRWSDFSIQNGETTTFVQPNSSSATLNRVTGNSASQLNGNLNANGRVYLVNPNGVVVGKTGRVNTGSFTASTHDVSDSDFLKGGDMTFSGNSKAKVSNEGSITAADGDGTLIARQVENKGSISAPKGSAHLAGGTEVLVKPAGTQRVFIKRGSGAVDNSGSIEATAAELRAAGGNEYALAVNNSGIVRATAVDKSGGRIVLKAETGTVRSSGKLIASSKAPGKKGGSVEVTGDKVHLTATARVDVSSKSGKGGTARIGGGLQGKDVTIRNADVTVVDKGAQINANGGTQGGDVVVWSQQGTGFYGDITARGGTGSNDGGFAEISSHNYLDMRGTVDTGSGTLLLDPSNIVISNDPSAGFVAVTVPLVPNAQSSVLNAGDLMTLLGSQSVIVQTSGAYNDKGSLYASDTASGDILVQSSVTWATSSSLSLLAHDDVIVHANIFSLGGGDINIVAGRTTSATSFSAIVANPANYGYNGNLQNLVGTAANNGGNVYIGSGAPTTVRVGTYGGKINVAGYDVVIEAESGNASIGYTRASSGITVLAKHDVRLSAFGGRYAQIGDGASSEGESLLANITVSAGHDVYLTSSGSGYAKIGHGGTEIPAVVLGGRITVTAGNDVRLEGTTGESNIQIGHGGSSVDADSITGDITVTAGGSVKLLGSADAEGFQVIGNGGSGEVPTFGGNIQVNAGRDIVMQGNFGGQVFVIGNGADSGYATKISGDINVAAGGSILMQGTGANVYYIGNGASGYTHADISGNINVTAAQRLVMSPSGGSSISIVLGAGSFAQIGNGGYSGAANSITGDINVSADTIDMTTGLTGIFSFSQIGHGGVGRTVTNGVSGNINVQFGSSMNMVSGSLLAGIIQIGSSAVQGGLNTTISGDINVSGNGPLLMQATGIFSPVYIGHGSVSLSTALPPINGNITVTAPSIRLTEQAINDPTVLAAISSLLATIPPAAIPGFDLSSIKVGPIQAITFAKIGHTALGISLLPVTIKGDINVNFTDSLSVEGGNGGYSLAFGQIGHGGLILFSPGYDISGNIKLSGGPNSSVSIIGGKDLSFGGGNFALVGHTNIGVVFGSDVFDSPLLASLYTSIGYSGPKTIAPVLDGDISVTAGSLWVQGGQGEISFAQIGHFSPYSDLSFLQPLLSSYLSSIPPASLPPGFSSFTIPTPVAASNSGNILIALGGDFTLAGGEGEGSYAMIGHGGLWPSWLSPYLESAGDRSGQIDIRVGGESSLADGTGNNAIWWVGHTTSSRYNMTNADILFVTNTLDDDINSHSDTSTLTPRFSQTIANLAHGNLTFVSTNTEGGAILEDTGGVFDVASPYRLAILSSGDLTINAPITNSGGALYLVSGFDSSNLFGVSFDTGISSSLFKRPSESAGDLFINNSLTFGANISLISGHSIVISKGSVIQTDEDFLAVVDNFNALRPGFSDTAVFLNEGSIRSNRASIYAVSADLTSLGDITGLGDFSQTGVWFGDAAGTFGANYKLASTDTVLLPTLNAESNPDDRFRRIQPLANSGFSIYYDTTKSSPATGGSLHLNTYNVAPGVEAITP